MVYKNVFTLECRLFMGNVKLFNTTNLAKQMIQNRRTNDNSIQNKNVIVEQIKKKVKVKKT